jgi:hypothetical protein
LNVLNMVFFFFLNEQRSEKSENAWRGTES